MKQVKIKTSDFQNIFTKRNITWREKYLQTVWFVDMESHYEIHQKVNILGLITSILFYSIATIPILIINGVYGVRDVWKDITPYMLGKPIRVDQCYHGTEPTEALKKLAGFSEDKENN